MLGLMSIQQQEVQGTVKRWRKILITAVNGQTTNHSVLLSDIKAPINLVHQLLHLQIFLIGLVDDHVLINCSLSLSRQKPPRQKPV